MTMHSATDHSTPKLNLQPSKLWHWFETICRIPHGSSNEDALANHIMTWANRKNIQATRDSAGNVFLKKDATADMKDRQSIALQAHLDMVTESNAPFDFQHSPISPYIDGEWVTADGTTLGADNGIGLASILALLDSDDISHPALEAVLTMTEETGMDGARALDGQILSSKFMINTDTEEIGEIYLGCAGGIDADIKGSFNIMPINDNHIAYELTLSGLKGGHSGIDIHKNNANAIKLLALLLANITPNFALNYLKGGSARNAIPRHITAIIVIDKKDMQEFLDDVNCEYKKISQMIGAYESALSLSLTTTQTPNNSLSYADSQKIIHLINILPNGVIRNSDTIDAVETSLSMGRIHLDNGVLHITSLIRSLTEIGKQSAQTLIASGAKLTSLDCQFSGSYIGWTPNPDSVLAKLAQEAYTQILGRPAKFSVIHAGLECGLIQNAYPDMDIISIGPTIKDAHSPDERVHIDSVSTYWQVLLAILARAPKKT